MYSYYFMEITVLGIILMSALIMPIIVASNKKHGDSLNDINRNLNNKGGMDMNGFMQMFGMLHSMGFFNNQNNMQNPNGNNMPNMNMNQNPNMSPYMLNNNKPKKTMTPFFAIAGIVFGLLIVIAII